MFTAFDCCSTTTVRVAQQIVLRGNSAIRNAMEAVPPSARRATMAGGLRARALQIREKGEYDDCSKS